MYYYSPTTKAFYHSDINKNIPSDSIPLTDVLHQELIDGVNNGKDINVSGTSVRLVNKTVSATWDQVRRMRDTLLIKSDYTQLPDYPKDNKELWAVYRQALRDIPSSFNNPNSVVWPTPPQ